MFNTIMLGKLHAQNHVMFLVGFIFTDFIFWLHNNAEVILHFSQSLSLTASYCCNDSSRPVILDCLPSNVLT